MDGARKLDRIAMALDVHVERHGLGAQQVVVQRADLDAAFLELAHDRGHLVLRQHEIAHDHGLVPIGWKATQPPNAKPVRSATPSSDTLRSVRGKPTR